MRQKAFLKSSGMKSEREKKVNSCKAIKAKYQPKSGAESHTRTYKHVPVSDIVTKRTKNDFPAKTLRKHYRPKGKSP